MRTVSQMQVIQLFEQKSYQRGHRSENGLLLDAKLWSVLEAKHKGFAKYYQLQSSSLRIFQYVGILPLGNYLLEILPKIDQLSTGEEGNWADILIALLQYSKLVMTYQSGKAPLAFGHHHLHESIVNHFVDACEKLDRAGRLRYYEQYQAVDLLPKGRIDWAKQHRRLPVPPPVFHIFQRKSSQEHPYDQVIAAALRLLTTWPNSHQDQKRLGSLMERFPLKQWPSPAVLQDQSLPQGIYAGRYEQVLNLSRQLLKGLGPNLRPGRIETPSLVFDMNLLFENYLYQQIANALTNKGNVRRQVRRQFWRRQVVRPDIVLDLDGKAYVLDTKWKVLKGGNPSAEDLRQLYVYQRVFAARRGVLIYPKIFDRDHSQAYPYQTSLSEPQPYEAQLVFVDVIKDGQLNEDLGKELIEVLLQHPS